MHPGLRNVTYTGALVVYACWRVLRNRAVLWLAIGLLAFANYQHSVLIDHLVWEIKAVNMKCDVLTTALFSHLRGSYQNVRPPGPPPPKPEPDSDDWRTL